MFTNASAVNVFYNSCFDLAKTLCIKSEDSALAINKYLDLTGFKNTYDSRDKTTWKYYKNICGEYFETDLPIYINSLDTQEQMLFSKENLAKHPATALNYIYGTRYYYTLLNTYPEQEQLILGIIYPAELTEAIASPDNTILTYPKHLVEPQEITLIHDLQQWIHGYQVRWRVNAFALTDNLYQVAQHALFYQHVLMKIINLRQKNAKTIQAHSFHIRQYLASHQGLDIFTPYLKQEQLMFLYRNILYIERHPGWRSTFAWLVQELLTKRDIPLSEYYIKLTTAFSDYKSILSFNRKPINPAFDTGSKTKIGFDEFVNKMVPLAPGNAEFIGAERGEIQSTIQHARSDFMLTKTLESSMLDYTDAVPHTLTDILINEWMYLSLTNRYTAFINFTDPSTLFEYSLSAKDALIYLVYLNIKAGGLPIDTIPKLHATKVLKNTPPPIADMLALCDTTYTDAKELATLFLKTWPATQDASSVKDFYDICNTIYDKGLEEWYQTASNGHYFHRAQLKNMANHQYMDIWLDTGYTGWSFKTWISDRGLPDPAVGDSDIQDLIASVYEAGTNLANIARVPFADIQKAMINILSLLSSYSIQIIKNINTTKITMLNWPAIRIGISDKPVDESYIQTFYHIKQDVNVLDVRIRDHRTFDLQTREHQYGRLFQDTTCDIFEIRLANNLELPGETKAFKDLNYLEADKYNVIQPAIRARLVDLNNPTL